jgi:lysophospholipase L1-like esterase
MATQRASKPRKLVVLAATLAVGLFCALIVVGAELVARRMEPKSEGEQVANIPDAELGWLPKPGQYSVTTSEFEATASVNSLNMNDREVTDSDLSQENRILVLGDSHTFAIGVSTFDTWPKQLEAGLFLVKGTGVVWNAAVTGYSVGQYLERFRRLSRALKPTLVIVGFSMATDLYDLIPPERGGFVYGGDAARAYFDLGPNADLIQKVYSPSAAAKPDTETDPSLRLRHYLEQFALYRMLKRSNLAMWVAIHYKPGGRSLWPGLDTALKTELSEDDKYRWMLAERVLGKLVEEAGRGGAQVAIVNIPYLAVVYDDTWLASFGAAPDEYDRLLASKRLEALCERIGALCIDTTTAFIDAARKRGRWLHFPQDAHPTAEGHKLIATVVEKCLIEAGLESGTLNTRQRLAKCADSGSDIDLKAHP